MRKHGISASAPIGWTYAGIDGGEEAAPTVAAARSMAASAKPRPEAVAPRPTARGFRPFAKEPTRRWSIDGTPFDPSVAPQLERAKALLNALSRRIGAEFDDLIGDDPTIPGVPSGYTYLFQLVGHDLVHSSTSPAVLSTGAPPVDNLRREALRLQTIYGAGFGGEPDVHAAWPDPDSPNQEGPPRPLLRLGRADCETPPTGGCPFKDIPRARVADTTGRLDSVALLADPRNDHNPILAQVVVLFARLHNHVAGMVLRQGDTVSENDDARAYRAWRIARAVTTLIYRRIVTNDLMGRVLHPAVKALYDARFEPLHDPYPDGVAHWRPPFEFTNAALRVPHAMVRLKYFFNAVNHEGEFTTDVLRHNSEMRAIDMPLDDRWIVDWSRFLDMPGKPKAVNRAMRLRPRNHTDLRLLPGEPSTTDGRFPDSGDLFFRDNLSFVSGGGWSVAGLRDLLAADARFAPLLATSPLLRAADAWVEPIRAWLATGDAALGDRDARTLAADPPLPLFLLLEAKLETPGREGERFGLLGSILLADVVHGLLRADPIAGVADAAPSTAFREIERREGLPRNFLGGLDGIETMPSLVTLVS